MGSRIGNPSYDERGNRYNSEVHGLDIRIFHWINDWDVRWRGLYVLFSEATKYTNGTFPTGKVVAGLLALILIAAGPTTRKGALIGIFAVIISNSMAEGSKYAFQMLRPCVELQDMT